MILKLVLVLASLVLVLVLTGLVLDKSEVVSNRVITSTTKVYRKTVNVTSQLDGVKFDCHLSLPAAATLTHPVIFTCGRHLSSASSRSTDILPDSSNRLKIQIL